MSDYVPTDWVDNVTPVDAARMDHIEAGIDLNRDAVIDHETRIDSIEAGKENKSEKGAVNGYAPLDATTKVPAIYLPAGGGGGGVDYDGVWAAGTPYVAGDVVLHNGVEYLAVNPSTGQTPPAVVPASPASIIPLVTVLPSSPFDGQEVDFTDSLLTPSYIWRFRYVAAAPSNKWKFVGGAAASAYIGAAQSPSATGSWVDLSTVGPQFSVPVAGDYDVEWEARITGVSAPTYSALGVAAGATVPPATSEAHAAVTGQSDYHCGFNRHTGLAAGADLRVRYYSSNLSDTWASRGLRVRPVAVSG